MGNTQKNLEEIRKKLREIKEDRIIVVKHLLYIRFLSYGSNLLLLLSILAMIYFWFNIFKSEYIPLNYIDAIIPYVKMIIILGVNISYFILVYRCSYLLNKEYGFSEVEEELCYILKSLKNEELIYKTLLCGAKKSN